MTETNLRWLDAIILNNESFRQRITPDKLPLQRTPGSLAVITCMDPRINLEAIGIQGFSQQGEGTSSVRIIRSIGAMAEPRSLAIGIFMAGIREIVVLFHTDCGCCLAHSKIDIIIETMQKTLSTTQLQTFKATIGEPFRERLMEWLKVFEDPRVAVRREVDSMRSLPFMPDSVIIHGLLYDLASGGIEVIINGYDTTADI